MHMQPFLAVRDQLHQYKTLYMRKQGEHAEQQVIFTCCSSTGPII